MKIVKRYKYSLIFIALSGIFGLCVLYNQALLGIIALLGMYACEVKLRTSSNLSYYLTSSSGLLATFFASTWWFSKITAEGWDNRIGIFSPSIWLMLLLFLVIMVTSLAAAVPKFLLVRSKFTFLKNSRLSPTTWATSMLLAELILSFGFSVLVHGNGVPIMASWNFFAAALLVPANSWLGFLFTVLGFWGVSYVVFLSVANIYELTHWLKNRKKLPVPLIPVCYTLILILAVFAVSTLQPKQQSGNIHAIVTSTPETTNYYLKNLLEHAEQRPNGERQIVVLPEYSALLRPYPDGLFNKNTDYRQQIKELKRPNLYVVGTEDVYQNGKRHVETYVLNAELEVSKRKQKTFLVPGGEYMVPWIGSLMGAFDESSVSSFSAQRGRYVIKELPPDITDEFSQTIGIGACSTLLTPFQYQNQVADKATILTANVSYAQFQNAKEYEHYATRFASLIARGLERPFALSSVRGNGFIMDPNGKIIAQTENQPASRNVQTYSHKTIYAKLGDAKIIALILAINLGIFLASFFLRKLAGNRSR